MCKQSPSFCVRTVLCSNGERFPVLVHRESGIPDFDATLWVVTSLRSRGVASATIEQALRSVIVLLLVLHSRQINLVERFRQGGYLDPEEIEAIAAAARQKQVAIISKIVEESKADIQPTARKIISLEKMRMVMPDRNEDSDVGAGTTAIRMGYIREFLRWRVNQGILRAADEKKANLLQLRDLVDADLQNRTPVMSQRATLGDRMGIGNAAQDQLLDMVKTTDSQNPWRGEFIRARNQFIVNAFLALGVRRSELLGVRTGDFKPLMQELWILRRPDDKDDPRLREPNVKTRDRVLPVPSELYRMMKSYLILRHEIVHGAHDFLLVSQNGDPLGKTEVNRIFRALDSIPGLPNVTPHILRHTFCENLADDLHSAGKSDDEILVYLRRLGGWSDMSNTPRRYTKRFAQERAAAAGKSMQQKLYKNDSNGSAD